MRSFTAIIERGRGDWYVEWTSPCRILFHLKTSSNMGSSDGYRTNIRTLPAPWCEIQVAGIHWTIEVERFSQWSKDLWKI